MERLSEMMARVHAGFRRRLARGALLSDPHMQALHDRLLALAPRELVRRPIAETRFVVIDTETTGLHAYGGDEIVSIALLELQGLTPTGREFASLVNPGRPIPTASTRIHGITDADVAAAPVIEELYLDIAAFIGESVLVGHHLAFDIRFLNKTLQRELLCHLRHPGVDTMNLHLAVSGRMGHSSLEQAAAFVGVPLKDRHSALGDVRITAEMFRRLAPRVARPSRPTQELLLRQHGLPGI